MPWLIRHIQTRFACDEATARGIATIAETYYPLDWSEVDWPEINVSVDKAHRDYQAGKRM